MTTPEARLGMLREALLTGTVTRQRLVEALEDVEALGLHDPENVTSLSRDGRRTTDSLALMFVNLVSLMQDQLIRVVLLIEEDDVVGMTRRDQRRRAESLGIVDPALHLERAAEVRNRIAHQYPRDPARQLRLLQDIAAQSRVAVAAFDSIHAYCLPRYFSGRLD